MRAVRSRPRPRREPGRAADPGAAHDRRHRASGGDIPSRRQRRDEGLARLSARCCCSRVVGRGLCRPRLGLARRPVARDRGRPGVAQPAAGRLAAAARGGGGLRRRAAGPRRHDLPGRLPQSSGRAVPAGLGRRRGARRHGRAAGAARPAAVAGCCRCSLSPGPGARRCWSSASRASPARSTRRACCSPASRSRRSWARCARS